MEVSESQRETQHGAFRASHPGPTYRGLAHGFWQHLVNVLLPHIRVVYLDPGDPKCCTMETKTRGPSQTGRFDRCTKNLISSSGQHSEE